MVERIAEGLFDRVCSMLEVVEKIPDTLSDEEVAGLLKLLPPDVSSSIGALLIPRVREAGMGFLKMVSEWMLGARRHAEDGKKVILVPFNFPPEILHAFDNARPLTSEVLSTIGVVALEGQGERYFDMALGLGMPDHICSSNAISLGSMLGSEDFKPQALISSAPGGCDINSKIHEFVSHYLDIPQFFLQKPPDDSERGKRQYLNNTRSLIRQLEEFLDEKMTEEKMRKVTEKANRCTELHYELMDLNKAKPCPVPNVFSLLLYGTRFTMWGTDPGIRMMEIMVEVAKKRYAEKAYPAEKEVARCVWAYTSYYYDFANFFNWMEEKGYSHLGDGLDLYFPEIIDTSSAETMLEGWATAAANMPMTRQVGAESMSGSWTNDVIVTCKDLNADCVIYCGHHSCKQTQSVVSILQSELDKRIGLPMLILQGDSWIRRMTPMSVLQHQIDEFIQTVVADRDKPKRRVRRRKPKAGAAKASS